MEEKQKLPPTVELDLKCPWCGKSTKFIMSRELYESNVPYKHLFPDESAFELDLLMHGTCSDCWQKKHRNQS